MQNGITYLASLAASASTALAQVHQTSGGVMESWAQLAIQAGMAGVVVLLLMKFFPMMLDKMEAKDRAHEDTIRHIIESNSKKDEAWQKLVQERVTCPMQNQNQNQGN